MKTLLAKLAGKRGATTDHLNLLICGGQRCGTSSIKYYLEEHPDINCLNNDDLYVGDRFVSFPFASPVVAESQIGDDPETYRIISRRLAGKCRYIGTKQPYFMVQPHVPFNIASQLPDARLLFVLRNPIDAAYSAYRNGLSKGRRKGTFEESIKLSLEAGREKSHPDNRSGWLRYFRDPDAIPLLVDRGFYYPLLMRFHTCIPSEQILVLRFEDLTQRTAETMRQVLEFLDLDPGFRFTRLDEVRNPAPKNDPINPQTRAMLNEIYHHSNQRLIRFLDWPEDTWAE